jgi:hypothetical protein
MGRKRSPGRSMRGLTTARTLEVLAQWEEAAVSPLKSFQGIHGVPVNFDLRRLAVTQLVAAIILIVIVSAVGAGVYIYTQNIVNDNKLKVDLQLLSESAIASPGGVIVELQVQNTGSVSLTGVHPLFLPVQQASFHGGPPEVRLLSGPSSCVFFPFIYFYDNSSSPYTAYLFQTTIPVSYPVNEMTFNLQPGQKATFSLFACDIAYMVVNGAVGRGWEVLAVDGNGNIINTTYIYNGENYTFQFYYYYNGAWTPVDHYDVYPLSGSPPNLTCLTTVPSYESPPPTYTACSPIGGQSSGGFTSGQCQPQEASLAPGESTVFICTLTGAAYTYEVYFSATTPSGLTLDSAVFTVGVSGASDRGQASPGGVGAEL